MPPKKAATASEVLPPASDAPEKDEKTEQKTASADLIRKATSHPSTINMVREALKELDSRKGVSSQAIQSYIKQTYPSVDVVRLRHLVRKTLIKGLESGLLVRPANSTVTNGAQGKFRLAPKQAKEPKQKTENSDPNVQTPPKAPKEKAKKPKETGATKKNDTAKKQSKSQEAAKKAKTDEGATTSKAAPAKRPKAKKAAEDGGDGAAKPKAKTAKGEKASQSKAAKAEGDAPVPKAAGKRGKKAAE